MNLVFRVDAGGGTGIGHLKRCLALASSPRFHGWKVRFVAGGDFETARDLIAGRWEALPVGSDAGGGIDLMLRSFASGEAGVAVVDWRGADGSFFSRLRDTGATIVYIDDIGETPHHADVLLNSNAYAHEYSYATPAGTRLLLGMRYLLLREEFVDVPARMISTHVSEVLVTLGGADPRNLTIPVLRSLAAMRRPWNVTVVVGPSVRDREALARAARDAYGGARVLDSPSSLVSEMLRADVAISAGGQTLYELLRTGCPTIAVEASADQRDQLRVLRDAGAVMVCPDGDPASLGATAGALVGNHDARLRLSAVARSLIDGQGVSRVADAITAAASESELQRNPSVRSGHA